MRRVHGKFAQAEAQQQARQARIAAHFAAHHHRRAGAVRGADGVRHQLQHRRMQGVVEVRHGIVGAVDGQGVLDQVVGADGQKIQLLGEALHHERGGRNFDHAADLDAFIVGRMLGVQAFLGGLDVVQGLVQLRQRTQHRDQHLHAAVVRGAQDRAQLRMKQVRLGQAQADGAQAQRRVRALTALHLRQLLVRAQVQGADGDRQAFQAFRHAAVGQELLFLVRQFRPVHEQEFAAEQADAGSAVFVHQRDVLRQFDIGMQLHRCAVQGARRRARQALELLLIDFPLVLLDAVFGQHMLVGIDDDHTLVAIDDQQLALADQLPRMVQRHHRRNVQAARQDRGVGSRAADIGDEGGELVALEQDHVGRRQVVRHQDAGLFRRGVAARHAGVTQQGFQQALHHLHHVVLARAQIGVFDAVELIQQEFQLLGQRPFGVALLRLDQLPRHFG